MKKSTLPKKNFSEDQIDDLLSCFLFSDVMAIKDIRKHFDLNGICVIALNNMFFNINCLVADDSFIHHMANVFYPQQGKAICNHLFKMHFYDQNSQIYYPSRQLEQVKESRSLIAAQTTKYLDDDEKIHYPSFMHHRKEMIRCLKTLIKKFKADMPEHLLNDIHNITSCSPKFDVSTFYRVFNCCIGLDSSYIGFLKYARYQFVAVRKNISDMMHVLHDSNVYKYDAVHQIVYDPVQRLAHGLSAVPSEEEIERAASSRLLNYIFLSFDGLK